MLDNHPLISIIIPVYNAEAFIAKALDSCLQQSFKDFEIVAIDDGSKDSSLSILKSYAQMDARVRVFAGANAGVVVARETGVKVSKGDFLLFIDADDTLVDECLQKMVNAITPEVDIVIGNTKQVETDGSCLIIEYGNQGVATGKEHFNWITCNRVGFLWGKLIRKTLVDSIKVMPYGVKFCEDYIQMLQMSYAARSVVHINDVTYNYIQQDASACNKQIPTDEYVQRFADICRKLTELINQCDFDKQATIRLKVLFLYYCRLYLSVKGRWGKNNDLKPTFRKYLHDNMVRNYYMATDKRRYYHTLIISWVYPVVALVHRKQLQKNGRIK